MCHPRMEYSLRAIYMGSAVSSADAFSAPGPSISAWTSARLLWSQSTYRIPSPGFVASSLISRPILLATSDVNSCAHRGTTSVTMLRVGRGARYMDYHTKTDLHSRVIGSRSCADAGSVHKGKHTNTHTRARCATISVPDQYYIYIYAVPAPAMTACLAYLIIHEGATVRNTATLGGAMSTPQLCTPYSVTSLHPRTTAVKAVPLS